MRHAPLKADLHQSSVVFLTRNRADGVESSVPYNFSAWQAT
eukprot:jgi/Botrbrau1/16577/Bobra.0068s0008.1